MSNLKHLTVDQLRAEVASISAYRSRLEQTIAINDEAIRVIEAQSAELRTKNHNAGQREAWARIYLARKT